MKNNKKITIIFPTHNGWDDTKECLTSIRKVLYPKKMLDIIVVDNNSSDSTPELINKFFPEVTVIKLSENFGYSKAVNIGIKHSKGTYIMLGNNDVVYEKHFFKSMVTLAESDSAIGVIGGKAFLTDIPKKIAFGGLRLNPYLGYHHYDLNNLDKVRPCDIVPPGGFFIRRAILDKVGLMDEGFFLYYEDVDFLLRVKRNGYKVIYNPYAKYLHGYGKTAFKGNSSELQQIIYYGYRSKWRCLIINATVLQIIISFIIYACILIHIENIRSSIKTYKPFLRSIHWNIIHLKETLEVRKKRTKFN